MSELSDMWEKLALNAKEEDEMEITEDWSSMLRGRGHLCVTVKVISDRRFNRDALKQTLRCLLLVTPLDGDVQPSKLEMNLVPFWIQIHDLPFLYMNRDVGEKVGGTLGMVFMVDTDVKGVGWGKSLRVRVQIDVTQPLLCGKKLRLGGKSVWVYFKYERLPLFCYGCGRIWHGGGGCPAHAQMRAKGVVGDDIIEHQEDEAERMADTDGGWNSNRKIDHYQASSSTRSGKDGRVSAVGSSTEFQKESLGLIHSTRPSGLLKTVPLIKSSGPRIELEKDQAGSSLGGDEVGLTQVGSLPNSIQAQHSTSSADKSGSLKKPTKYQKRSQRALSSTRGRKTKGTTSGRRVLEGKKNSGFKRSQVLKLLCDPAGPNEAVQLELPKAWEPLDSSGSSQFGEDESAPDPVLERNKTRCYDGGSSSVRVTGFYGHPEGGRRRESWNLLKSLGNQFDLPWVCCGDFNELVESSEKVGGLVRPDWQMRQFREALSEAGLSSLPSSGPRFTWRGRRHGVGWIKERLDRFVANGEWLALYPSLCCINVVSSASDHCPIFMETNPITQGFRRKRFRFEAMWLTHAQCKDQVELAWGSAIEGDPLGQVTRKIKDCKTNLMAWDKDVFGNVTRKIKVESKKLEALERLPAGELVEEQICCLKKELNALANQRKRRNGMEGLFDHNGQWVTGQKDIAQVTVQCFNSIFSTSHPTDVEMSAVLDQVSPKVTEEMNQALGKEFTAVEVGAALAQMGPTKAPGPNGMPPIFYQSFWPQIGTTVTQAVLECLNQGVSLQSINHTHLVLIPKKLSPTVVTEYRPISLWRQIVDNIMVAFEAMHSLNNFKGRGSGQMALKLDMSKAYDRVEWRFVEGMMSRLGFTARGLRQGDPLSQYLFLLCGEGLFALLHRAEESVEEYGVLMEKLKLYEKASGQSINTEKTSLFFSHNTGEAKVKPGCSYIWRSIATARSVLEQGSKWRVGNGECISIRKDRWVPDQTNGVIHYPLEGLSAGGNDVASILQYPLLPSLPKDALIWWGTPSGNFSVKSAYHTAFLKVQIQGNPESSNSKELQLFWKAVWALKLPRKIQSFVWRLSRNILPTRDNLVKRNISSPMECPICGAASETTKHIFGQCIYARKVWEGKDLAIELYNDWGDEMFDTFWNVWKFKGEMALKIVAVVSWSLWNVRNSAVFRDVVKIPAKVFPDAMKYIQEFTKANALFVSFVPPIARNKIVWSAPLEGWYKVNMDGAVFADLGKVGVGVVIRNKRGEFLGVMCELLEVGLDATDAEALAALRAIEFAAEVCPFSMLFEGDCLQVIRALQSPEYDAARVGHIYSLARSKLSLFRDFSVSHVFREGNTVAHRLAKFARNVTGSQVWLEHVPSFLGQCLAFDVPVQFR
uniref:RNase H type-1 domain-containing protein n=1 Tax=Fagus sylvatica TaxID=28930 RepID=A0A2N9IT87_FAGSY